MNVYYKNGEKRIWIQPDELEDLMSFELEKANRMPSLSNPVVDLEKFVEKHLKAKLDPYATLEPGVLGETEFRVGVPIKVSINKDLTGAALDDDFSEPGMLGRWRATIAHEASHVILHRQLFDLSGAKAASLFEDPSEPAEPEVKHLQRCLKREVLFRGGGGDWRETQANMGMAALLMPKKLFIAAFQEEIVKLGVKHVEKNSNHVSGLISTLAGRFQVSKQAAGIRFETLQLLTNPGQIHLIQ